MPYLSLEAKSMILGETSSNFKQAIGRSNQEEANGQIRSICTRVRIYESGLSMHTIMVWACVRILASSWLFLVDAPTYAHNTVSADPTTKRRNFKPVTSTAVKKTKGLWFSGSYGRYSLVHSFRFALFFFCFILVY